MALFFCDKKYIYRIIRLQFAIHLKDLLRFLLFYCEKTYVFLFKPSVHFVKKQPNYLRKMHGYPLFSFHIPITQTRGAELTGQTGHLEGFTLQRIQINTLRV